MRSGLAALDHVQHQKFANGLGFPRREFLFVPGLLSLPHVGLGKTTLLGFACQGCLEPGADLFFMFGQGFILLGQLSLRVSNVLGPVLRRRDQQKAAQHGGEDHQQRRGGDCGDSRIATAPPCHPFPHGHAAGADRLVPEESLQIVGEFPGGLVAPLRFRLDRLVDDGRQVARRLRVGLAQRRRRARLDLRYQLVAAFALVRRRQVHQFIEGQAERVDVATGIGAVWNASGAM